MDSGASFHATSHREYFSEYIQGNYGQVFLSDDHPCSIVAIGKIRMKLQNGNILVLNGVRHVPDLKRNLVSSSMLDKEGFVTSFGENSWKVTKGYLILARGKMVGTLYLLTNASHICTLDSFSTKLDVEKWHHRLGHMSEKGMKILHSQKLLPKLKEVGLGFYEYYIYGKQKRVRFLKVGKEKKNQKLELVHSDVWGPTQVTSLGGANYYVTFINDATRKTWVYNIRNKFDVFDTFQKWKALVENDSGKKLKCLKSDNGGEYCSNDFDNYCARNGIRRIKVTPRTQQENGVSERMNKMIMEWARCMRLHASLPLFCWDNVVDIAIYLINRGPSSTLDSGIPKEA